MVVVFRFNLKFHYLRWWHAVVVLYVERRERKWERDKLNI